MGQVKECRRIDGLVNQQTTRGGTSGMSLVLKGPQANSCGVVTLMSQLLEDFIIILLFLALCYRVM